MADEEIIWPVGTSAQDPALADRPYLFAPRGFLVAVLTDAGEAQRAAAALQTVGFTDRELRIFAPDQILEDYARYTAQKSVPRRVVTALTDDRETLDLYHGHARDGRYALWVHVADDDEAGRAIRGLSGSAALHIRHYGHHRQSDFHLQRPTTRAPRAERGFR
ncbi:hypothetical protein ACI780_17950 [Geodermatophilus sp. SYSU D00814]